jgi:hypothetical protein
MIILVALVLGFKEKPAHAETTVSTRKPESIRQVLDTILISQGWPLPLFESCRNGSPEPSDNQLKEWWKSFKSRIWSSNFSGAINSYYLNKAAISLSLENEDRSIKTSILYQIAFLMNQNYKRQLFPEKDWKIIQSDMAVELWQNFIDEYKASYPYNNSSPNETNKICPKDSKDKLQFAKQQLELAKQQLELARRNTKYK